MGRGHTLKACPSKADLVVRALVAALSTVVFVIQEIDTTAIAQSFAGFAGVGASTDTVYAHSTIATGVVTTSTMQRTGLDVGAERATLDLTRRTTSSSNTLTIGTVLISSTFVPTLPTIVSVSEHQSAFSTTKRLSGQASTFPTRANLSCTAFVVAFSAVMNVCRGKNTTTCTEIL
jgi:hypothetical protein